MFRHFFNILQPKKWYLKDEKVLVWQVTLGDNRDYHYVWLFATAYVITL